MVESIYSGRARGLRSNRQFGLQQQGSQRADERLQLDRSRLGERQRQAQVAESRAQRNERRMADAMARRLNKGITTPPQIIKEAAPFQDESVTRLTPDEEQPIMQFLERQGKQATAIFRRGDGSYEIMNQGGQSAVIPGQALSEAIQKEEVQTRKAAADAKSTELREKDLELKTERLRKQSEREMKKTEGMTAADARIFRTYESEFNRAFRQYKTNLDFLGEPKDPARAAELRDVMDAANEKMSSLRASYVSRGADPGGGKSGATPSPQATPAPAQASIQERITELRALQNDPRRSQEIREMAARAADELERQGAPAQAPVAPAPVAQAAKDNTVLMRAPDGSEARVPQDKIETYTKLGAVIVGK